MQLHVTHLPCLNDQTTSITVGLHRNWVMSKETLRLSVYLGTLALCVTLLAVATFSKQFALALAAFGLLGAGWLFERLFWGRRRGQIRGKRLQQMHEIGTIVIDGQLRISDQLSISESQVLRGLTKGPYSVRAETWSDGHDVYISAVILNGAEPSPTARNQEVKLTVDTGFLIFAGADPSDELLRRVREAQSRIVSAKTKDLDAELFAVGGKNVGIVSSTGFGDGQYLVKLHFDANLKPEIVCRFINEN
jgi:hypothetical protein